MLVIRSEYDEKVKHINLYIDMLKDILVKNAELRIAPNTNKTFDPDLVKVLKANVFLLLYNLIESTIRKTIEYIHISVNNDSIQFKDVNEEIQKIWIEFQYNNFKDYSSDQIISSLKSMINDLIIIDYENYINKRKANDFSGNIDSRKVKALSEKYSFNFNKRINGNKLVIIKSRRNNLAHGNITFTECGKDYTYHDLYKFKQEAILFLSEFLMNVEDHTKNKRYKKL